MEIIKRQKTAKEKENFISDLQDIGGKSEVKPPVCNPRCQKYKDIGCHHSCPDARFQLSSEKEYPLDPLIAPLVFELKKLGVFHPCWSCEGHTASHDPGAVWKVPSVWFYAHSVTHVRILDEAIKKIHCDGLLNVPWQISVTHSDPDNSDTSFALKPESSANLTSLPKLQEDIATLAEKLQSTIQAQTSKLL